MKAFAPDGQKITIKAGDADALVRAGGSVATQQEIVDDKYGNTMNPLAQAALGGIGVGLNPQLRSLQLGGEQGLTGGLSKVFQKEAVRALAGDEVAKKYVRMQDEISQAYSTENKIGEVSGMALGALAGSAAGGAALQGAGLAGKAGALGRAGLTGPIGGISALGEIAEGAVGQALKGYAARGALQNMGTQALKLGLRGAVEGGLMGALDQTTDDMFHDKDLAASKLFVAAGHNALWGLAGGAALGAAGAGLSSLAGRAGALRGASAGLSEQVDGALSREFQQGERMASGSIGEAQQKFNAAAVANGAAEQADLAVSKGVSAADRKAGAGFLKDFSSESAVRSLYGTKTDFVAARKALGDDGLKELGNLLVDRGIVRAGENVVDSMPRLVEAQRGVGEALGAVVKQSDSRVPFADVVKMAKNAETELLKKGPEHVGAADSILDAMTKVTRNLEANGAIAEDGSIAISDLLKARRGLESIAYDTGKLGTSNAKQAISKLSRDIEDHVMENLAKANPEVSKAYAPLKREYQLYSKAIDIAKSGTGRIEGNQTFSLTSKLMGLGSLAASGNPLVAGASLFGMKALQERGSATAAVLAARLSERTAAQAMMHTADDIFARASAGVMKWSGKATDAEGILANQEAKNVVRKAAASAPKPQGSVVDQANREVKAIREAQASPAATQERIATAVAQLARNAPETAAALTATMERSLAFIASKAPKETGPYAPLSPTGRTATMDPVEASKFLRYVDAAKDPRGALERIERGTVRSEDVEMLKVVHPPLYQQFRVRVLQGIHQMQENGKPMAYSARIKVSLLADIPGDATLQPEYLNQLQKNVTVSMNAGDATRPPKRPVSIEKPKLTGLDRLEES